MAKSFKPEYQVTKDPVWYGNALRFQTIAEAERNARDLAICWVNVTAHRASASEDEPNYIYTEDGKLVPIEKEPEA